MKIRTIAVTGFLAACLLTTSAVPAGEGTPTKPKKPTGYSEVPFGATEKDVREKLNLTDEWDCTDLHDVRHCSTHFVLGDYAVMVTLDLIDDRFGRIITTFPTSEFDLMRTTFVEKYGQPHSSSTVPVRTRANVPYRNAVLRWKWSDVDATLERFGENVDRGRASITTSEFRDALKTLDERAKKKAKDAPF